MRLHQAYLVCHSLYSAYVASAMLADLAAPVDRDAEPTRDATNMARGNRAEEWVGGALERLSGAGERLGGAWDRIRWVRAVSCWPEGSLGAPNDLFGSSEHLFPALKVLLGSSKHLFCSSKDILGVAGGVFFSPKDLFGSPKDLFNSTKEVLSWPRDEVLGHPDARRAPWEVKKARRTDALGLTCGLGCSSPVSLSVKHGRHLSHRGYHARPQGV